MILDPREEHLEDPTWEPFTLSVIVGYICRRKFLSFLGAGPCNAQQIPLAGSSSDIGCLSGFLLLFLKEGGRTAGGHTQCNVLWVH